MCMAKGGKAMKQKIPSHETFKIAALLALVGGFLDAYTYLLRGGVFANAQTGNIVLLAVNMAERQWGKAGYYLIPIAAFAVGVFVTNLLRERLKKSGFLQFEHCILLFEAGLLFVIGFLPAEMPDGIINVMIPFICSLQVNAFRKVREVPYASTMCTGNLRSGTEKLYVFLMEGDRQAGKSAVHYWGVIFLFIAGAAAGTIAAGMIGIKSIWLCCVLLLLASLLMLLQDRR